MTMKFDRVLKCDDLQECLDCKYEGFDYGEIDHEDQDEAEVLCPKCGSTHYYIMNIYQGYKGLS